MSSREMVGDERPHNPPCHTHSRALVLADLPRDIQQHGCPWCSVPLFQVRAKAVKALAGVVECDPRVLTMKDVHAGVCNALMDESASVREAALDLLGKYISSNVKYAEAYFDILCRAVQVRHCAAQCSKVLVAQRMDQFGSSRMPDQLQVTSTAPHRGWYCTSF